MSETIIATNQKPYVATVSKVDWAATYTLLQAALPANNTPFWSIIETAFQLELAHNEIKVPNGGGQIARGRIFWRVAEIRFRYDGSRPVANGQYRLVLIADKALLADIFDDATAKLPDNDWQRNAKMQSLLWGEPLDNLWFTSRIPNQLNYPGIAQRVDRPIVKVVEYRHQGYVKFHRFTELTTEKILNPDEVKPYDTADQPK